MKLRISNSMRWRALAFGSLGVNLLLAAGWLIAKNQWKANAAAAAAAASAQTGQATSRTNVVVRRQFFSWREVESTDYPTYIANLRDIGCPEQTIRDIIIADVNALYARKRATQLVTAEQQWWRSEPDPAVLQVAAEKSRALEDERRGLLTRLLGANWESGDIVSLPRPSRPGIVLDGQILGNLPPETKQAIEEISLGSQDRLQAYLDEQRRQGKTPDLAQIAKLRQQTRLDLQKILTPTQLEEFLLRYSQNANDLRNELGQLRFFDATPDEFRAVFRGTDTLDQQIELLADATDPNSVAQRKSLEEQRENAMKTALGAKRYAEYQQLQDPVYRDAYVLAQQAGTPEAAQTIYEINLATLAEQNQVKTNATLTDEQKAIELKRIELEQLKANTLATGQDLPPEPTTPTQASPRRTHVVRPGDSLGVVGLLYGLPPGAIRDANPGIDFNRLKPGDSIYIPPSGLLPSSGP
jgi:LysM repeat protein